MNEILHYLLLGLILIGFVLIMILPIIILIMVINKKQRLYFTKLSDKYGFTKDLGKQKFRRAYPLVKGYINKRWTYVLATASADRSMSSNGTRYRHPQTEIAVKIENSELKKFNIFRKKRVKSTDLNFSDYFVVEMNQSNTVNLSEEIMQAIINSAYKDDFGRVSLKDGYLVTYVYSEIIKEKRYKKVISYIELLHKIADELSLK